LIFFHAGHGLGAVGALGDVFGLDGVHGDQVYRV
jgi:hypothetical protein